jgi:NAD(P)-dependent dehydrogenase (short-subunit alcohol dehydrogenase family)
MGILENKIALVTGGAGGVGEGIVEAFLEEGATVIVPSRREDRLRSLRGRLTSPGRLITYGVDVGSVKGAEALRDRILSSVGRIDIVVACLADRLVDSVLAEISPAKWQQILDTNLTAHFVVAKTFLPVLSKTHGSSYIFISSQHGPDPASIASAAQLRLKDVLAEEYKRSGVRINAVVLQSPVNIHAGSHDAPVRLTVDEVGRYVAYLASLLSSQVRGETIRLRSRSQINALAA